jgi:Cys-rich protein (TIGR04453 family)
MHHARIVLGLALLLTLSTSACSRSPCEQTCRRVAQCKREKATGEVIPGDSVPAADPTCLSRCEAATPEYAACEGKKRECEAVLQCIPYR